MLANDLSAKGRGTEELAVVERPPGVLDLSIRRPGRDMDLWRNVAIAKDLRSGSGLAAAPAQLEPVDVRPA